MSAHERRAPRVVIVGGGMGGIAAARKLARAPVEVTLVDACNYYVFQPLIYQVAGGMSNVEDITHSIRGLLRGQGNVRFRLATAVVADLDRHELVLPDGERLPFDYLILSTGLRSDVERVPAAAAYAFPLKTLDDALRIRNHLLRRLETAAAHPELVPAGALDMVIVGGGTTGVEVAAAFTEIYNYALRGEFPELDFSQSKITIVEAGDALLSAFHPRLQRAAVRMLSKRGAEVRFRSQVVEVGPASVTLSDGSEIWAGTVVWATGVRATPLADALGVAHSAGGRIRVSANLSLPGHPEVFAIGDMAALPTSDGRPIPRSRSSRSRAAATPPAKSSGTWLGSRRGPSTTGTRHDLGGGTERRGRPERPPSRQRTPRVLLLGAPARLLRPRAAKPAERHSHLDLELRDASSRSAPARRRSAAPSGAD